MNKIRAEKRNAFFLLQEKQRSNKTLEERNKAILEQKNEIEKVSKLASKATEDKMRFYSYISHEFKTPLSLILTPTEDKKNVGRVCLAVKNIASNLDESIVPEKKGAWMGFLCIGLGSTGSVGLYGTRGTARRRRGEHQHHDCLQGEAWISASPWGR